MHHGPAAYVIARAAVPQHGTPAAHAGFLPGLIIADGKGTCPRQHGNAPRLAQRAEIRVGRVAFQHRPDREGQGHALRKAGDKQV